MKKVASELYKQDLIDHSNNPRNYGIKPDCDFISGEQNPSCGDSVMICGFVDGSIVKEVRFEGSGCILSKAMASKLTEYAQGKSLQEILAFDEQLVAHLLGVTLGPNRLQCGMLSIVALQKGIRFYQKQGK